MRNMGNVHKSWAPPCIYYGLVKQNDGAAEKLKIGQSNLYVQKRNKNLADCGIFIIFYRLGI